MTQPERDEAASALNLIIEVAALPREGADYAIDANELQRRLIAHRLEIPALSSLRGVFRATPFSGGVAVQLKLDALAERQCVVSLEPMPETISETVTTHFERAFDETDLRDDDIMREPLDGDMIDLGELLIQHLSLSLDPYPRIPGAKNLADDYRSAATGSPFAVLKGLSDREN